MTGKVTDFSDLFDVCATLYYYFSILLIRKLPFQLLKDSSRLFHVISKSSRTSENSTVLDIAVAHEDFYTKLSHIFYLSEARRIYFMGIHKGCLELYYG